MNQGFEDDEPDEDPNDQEGEDVSERGVSDEDATGDEDLPVAGGGVE